MTGLPANAVSGSASAPATVQVLLAAVAVIVAVRLVGTLLARIGQPRVLGEIIAGILLGPSVLGLVWPQALHYVFPPGAIGGLQVLAQFGLVIFMFLVGIELNTTQLRGQGARALLITQTSIVLPVLLGAGLAWWLYPRLGEGTDRTGFVLFLGAAMSITAFPVLARILQETGLARARIGALTLACAAIGDLTAWCLLAVVVAAVQSTGPADPLLTLVSALAYLVAMFAVARPLLARSGGPPLWLVIVVMLLSAWVSEQIGVHAIFGAFVAGVVMPRETAWRETVHRRLEPAVSNLLLPVFFVLVGLSTRIDLLDSAYMWAVTALMLVVAVAGKFGGTTVTAMAMGERPRDAVVIGILMNTRGLTEIVILTVGLQLGVISATVFTMMVLMALVTTLVAVPALQLFSLRDRVVADDACEVLHRLAETRPAEEGLIASPEGTNNPPTNTSIVFSD